ncbi:hypothetical protein [Candidatus Endomicrobiellum agilis]|uniref:hypothetical protein n=1 Tax=Candidatus Endomicrobiellum agilis TaxID=3238957 RepID=UPI00357B5127|nr:hypothetical protein [Endomicrobium sp.]
MDDKNVTIFNLENKIEMLENAVKFKDAEKINLGLEITGLKAELAKVNEQNLALTNSNQSKQEQLNELNKVNIDLANQHRKDLSTDISKDSYLFNLQSKIATLENQLRVANEQIHFLNIENIALKQKNK